MPSLQTRLARAALVACACLLAVAPAWAQGTIRGTVTDNAGQPLPGANVVLAGTDFGAAAGVDGTYRIENVPAGTYEVRARFIGFADATERVAVAAGETVVLNFQLNPDLVGLDEVVVTGALSERARGRSEVAVARLDATDLTDRIRYQDLSQLVSGKLAGVRVSPASGNVGGGVRFSVRTGGGLSGGQPLIVIDGVRIDNSQFTGYGVGGQNLNALATLNPGDIQSIDVLKGPAAAALYGTDAANGVVLITTRRGQLGRAGETTVAFTYSGTIGQNTQQFTYTPETAGATVANANAGFRSGPIQEHVVGVSGGSSAVRFFAQYSTRNEEGILPGNFLERRNLRANFDAFPGNNITISASAGYTLNAVARPQNDNNIQGYLGNVLLQPIAYQFTDSVAVFSFEDLTRTNQYIGSFEIRYDPIPGLTLRAQAGIDAADARQDQLFPPGLLYPGAIGTLGQRNTFARENDQVSFQIDGRYSYTPMDALSATTAVGLQGFDRRVRTLNVAIRNLPSALLPDLGAATAFQSAGEFFQNERQLGILFDQSFDYADTYLLGFGGRYDVASSIGPEAPDVFYPFIRAAVLLNNFDFVPNLFTLFKPRIAYGESGVLPGAFQSIPILYGAAVGGAGAGAIPFQIGNPEIRPERIRELEFGLDVEIGDRFAVETTYYIQNATDSIVLIPNAPSSGLTASNQPFNVGGIRGQGFELALSGTPIRTANVGLDLSAIFNWSTNEVTSIGDAQPIFDGFSRNVIKEGLPRAAFLLQEVRGALFDSQGRYIGVDVGGTAPEDRVFVGTPYPKYTGSFSATLNLFDSVSLYALFDYALDLYVYNSTDAFRAQFGNYLQRTELAERLNQLTPGTPEYIETANAFARTDGRFPFNFTERADYLKFRELSVRFDVARFVRQAPGLQGVRTASLSLAGRNLWQTTRYSGLDPEVNFAGSASLSQGQDFLTLQNPRVFFATLTLGV